jgi:tetratricopeptide (TPR) repeat protein
MQEDDRFAYGPLVLAWSLSNQGRRPEGVVHAERALQLADNATPQERYFILATVHAFRGRGGQGPETVIERDEMEKAAAALEALFALQPDHYAVRNNLRTVYRLLGRDRDIAWMNQRLADARPWSVTENLEVARQLWREGNVEGARRYSARAESALSPVSWAGDVDAAASVRLFAAYIAWAQDDPNATIQALDRVAASAGTLPPAERRQLSVRLAPMYAAVGRLQDAERALDEAQPADQNDVAGVMTIAIARAALYEDWADLTRLREFASTRWREPLPPTAPALSARRGPFLIALGLLDDAERDLEWFKRRTAERAEWAPTVPRRQFQPFEASTRAAITLKRGRAAEAVAVLASRCPYCVTPRHGCSGPAAGTRSTRRRSSRKASKRSASCRRRSRCSKRL